MNRAAHSPTIWHLAQFKPNCASIAKRNLARQGFEVFLPLERRSKMLRNRFVAETRPYFPGYIFIGAPMTAAPARSIRSTQGIAQLVCFGAAPAQVPAGLVEALKQNCDTDDVFNPQEALNVGDRVQMVDGPFADLIGKIQQVSTHERAWVLLDVMGKATRISIPSSDLRLAG